MAEPKPAPATNTQGRLREEHWKGALRHRIDGAAVIERCPRSGIVVREEYWLDGVRHRKDGPAVIERDSHSGRVSREEFFIGGKLRSRKLTSPRQSTPGGCVLPFNPACG